MTKRQSIILFIALAVAIVGFLLFRPSLWQDWIESKLNDQLAKEGWTIQINELSGHLFSTLQSENISMVHENGASVVLPQITTQIKIAPLLKGKISIEELSVSHVSIQPYFESGFDSTETSNLVFAPERIPLDINKLHVDGNVYVPVDDSSRAVHFMVDGQIQSSPNVMKVALNAFEVFSSQPRINIAMKDVSGQLSSQRIAISLKEANINGLKIGGDFQYTSGDSSSIQAQLDLSEYTIPKKIFSQLPLQPELSKLSASFTFESNLTLFEGNLDVRNDIGLDMGGEFDVRWYDDHLRVESLALSGNDATLMTQGLIENSGRFNGTIQLDNLNVSQWMLKGPETNLSGYVLVDGQLDENEITALDINAEISESMLFDQEASAISGGISYRDFKMDITNPLTVTIGPSIVSVNGLADFNQRSLDLDLSLTEASTFLINNFWSDTLDGGIATGSMNLYGSFDTLGVDADLLIDGLQYNNISLASFEFIGHLNNINTFQDGAFKVKFGKGTWNNYGFESGTGEFNIFDSFVDISSFELKNGNDYLQFNGSVHDDSILTLDRFQIAYRNHYLINPRPVTMAYTDERFRFAPFEIHVDDGIIEGFIITNPIQGRLKFSNVTTDILSLIDESYGENIRGNIFGEVSIGQDLNPDDISLDITLKNGEVAHQQFDDFFISTLYRDGILHLEELTLTDGEKTGFQVMGTFPVASDSSQSTMVDVQSSFKNIDMTFFTQFSPRWAPLLFGKFTGNYTMGGTTQKTKIGLNGTIENAYYGRIPLGTVKGEAQYANKKLTISRFSADWEGNHITGKAELPIDYDIASPNTRKWHPDGHLDVETEGTFHSAVFLSEYMADTDSITGDIQIVLSIDGPPDRLMRNGHITIDNGAIYTVLMDEPIRHLQSKGTLVDNHMDIERFHGALYDTDRKERPDSNLTISGSIDFTKFFEPRYDLHAMGDDIFFRSLNGDIEGYGDLDVTMIGKDTLEIAGTIAARNGAIYMEFTDDEMVASSEEKGRTTTNYNIRFPIEETFSIRNSQIDATIAGELAMAKQFEGDWNYSGEIEFQEGEIYYYLGDVFKNLQGTMTMDGQGFNPFLELNASTKIGDAEIYLGVFGPFDNPEWTFDSDKGYTESDILQLLTFNTRVAEEGFTTEGLGSQAQTILGAYLERQLERNFVRATGLKSTGLLEDVEISGTSELIRPGEGEEFSISAKVNRNFSLSYQRSFSLESAYKNKVGVEYKLNPNFSVIGNVDEKGQVHMKFRVRRVY